MPLVDYSSSSSSSKEESLTVIKVRGSRPIKRKRKSPTTSEHLPPLPSTFYDLYASSTRPSTQDDPELHGGRQRVTPHIEGSWPSHVYIEWRPSRAEAHTLQNILSKLQIPSPRTNSLLQSDLGAPLPLHISLSRSIALLTHQREPFVSLFRDSLNNSATRPFTLSLHSLKWVPNFERTRWFLVLSVVKPSCNSLNTILRITNSIVGAFGQPPLYAPLIQPSQKSGLQPKGQSRGRGRERGNAYDKRYGRGGRLIITNNDNPLTITTATLPDYSEHFHVSLAWSLEPPSEKEVEMAAEIDPNEVKDMKIEVDVVKAKIGNAIHVEPLRKVTLEEGSRGILGV